MTNATKNRSDDLLNFCAIYKAQNADNARSLGISFEIHTINDFIIVKR